MAECRQISATGHLALQVDVVHEQFLAAEGGAHHPFASGVDDAGLAVVDGDDPQASGASPQAQVRFVELLSHLRPLAAVAATVDGVKDDPRAGTCQLLRQMGVGPWRTGRIRPQVVADQRSRHHARVFLEGSFLFP